ncbi:hypothetical protein Val02_77800 [Virgisporangium aliadipatigenens]|uniref:Ricin B lectin domain-containing protein n=1 Tax=Virgisporangium aliadipatigenens TaxID=741659 RepID=A0A8J3YSI4_9ACTN|nr:RICIN domain-containing protein [Virgisporangium aliadipatigenens]GIJ50894.1 hypothetical protein Val02_77800 [Virgisporangium aliadipatigenens]
MMTEPGSRRRLPRPLARLLPAPGDDTGSLPLAMMLITLGTILGGLLPPIFVMQSQTSGTGAASGQALHAAQTGLDLALAHIRSARDTVVKINGEDKGVLPSLPCGPFAGTVSDAGTARYEARIYYLRADPQDKDLAWAQANALGCAGSPSALPLHAAVYAVGYAKLPRRSTGAGGVAVETTELSRELRGTHTFRTSNAPVAGGLIRPSTTSTPDLCFAAPSENPSPGDVLTMQLCSPGSNLQKFEYTDNMTFVLAATRTGGRLGMCLDAGASPAVAGTAITFRPCGATAMPQQMWSFTDSSWLQATEPNGLGQTNNRCMQISSANTVGAYVRVGSSCGGGTGTFAMSAEVGAGRAVTSTSQQIVNFKQFGRCVDQTNFDVNYSFAIGWPCKQHPDPTQVGWNQRWVQPALPANTAGPTAKATGTIVSTRTGSPSYCLWSPGSVGAGSYVRLQPCPATVTNYFRWTVHGNTKDFTTMYRIIDGFGNCLSLTNPDANPADLYGSGTKVSKTIVETCSDSTMQKWNAPAWITEQSQLKDLEED